LGLGRQIGQINSVAFGVFSADLSALRTKKMLDTKVKFKKKKFGKWILRLL
jgi:hypothetical protein